MVASGNPLFLNVTTGGVSGAGSKAAKLQANLVANSLLDGSTVIDPDAIAAAQAAEDASGDTGLHVVEGGTPATTESEPGTLPSPTTH